MNRFNACVCAGLAVLGGCMPMITTPIVDPAQGQFTGVAWQLAKSDAPQPPVVIWLHGMCSHFDDWADTRAKDMGTLLGAKAEPLANVDVPGTRIHLRRGAMTVGGTTATFNFVMWSRPSIERKRERLCFDSELAWLKEDGLGKVCDLAKKDDYFPWERAKLNGALKATLMNDCLADAVYYAGANGKAIREAIRKAMCMALSDGDPGNADCRRGLPDRDVILVSESLGSKVLFDSVVCADAQGVPEPKAAANRDQAKTLTEALSRVTHLYLLANQLPILEMADPDAVCPDADDKSFYSKGADSASSETALSAFVRAIKKAKDAKAQPADVHLGPFVVVAFTDPNDLLSYRLTQSQIPKDAPGRVVNVLDSNAGTLLGLVERPDEAHLNYRSNKDVLRMLLCGVPPASEVPGCR